ncbi:hypothetical protein [Sinisalibacter aestuarii]|uniref:Rhodanese domain-containing protein n=1 Tax=Sinisalibacter aestuarii TaxID=2949426 RepID=A0ABQ5LTW6_9RHOB|nr:hypothetical protein [Sinisalibacter aestuarii]GKY88429.1 hypothetical protein STA1M1_22980 [Sinisalibacter aestuarii]
MRAGRIAVWGALALLPGLPLAAGPVAMLADLPDEARVIDIRAEARCLEASLPGARCLPAPALFGSGETPPVSFHALRWLLGTVGLSGAETVAVYGDDPAEALAVAALFYLAGQAGVAVIDGAPEAGNRGAPRSFSREVVFTAPMRLAEIRVDANAPGALRQRLETFARGDAPNVAFAPET